VPPWQMAGAYAKRLFQTLRHGVKAVLGMLARSAYASMANGQMAGAYAKRLFQTLRHGVKAALGMPARSACASMANGQMAGALLLTDFSLR
jgi:hypothetical protein